MYRQLVNMDWSGISWGEVNGNTDKGHTADVPERASGHAVAGCKHTIENVCAHLPQLQGPNNITSQYQAEHRAPNRSQFMRQLILVNYEANAYLW